ncbi:hypothetical protein ACT6NV_03240 [Robiginitalea sp. IMCC44478]|uniref:hypothetical protein n=1 Tax=Robiginitalea sp. IMCC44478 TaxID=3459122 RepID=UPI00404203EA
MAALVIVLMGVNPVMESSLDRYLQNKMRFLQDSTVFRISYEELNLNLFSKEFELRGLKILSLSETDSSGQDNEAGLLREMHIGMARIEGVDLGNFLWDHSLEVSEIDLDSVNLTFLKPDISAKREKKKQEKPVLDSLKLPGINRIKLGDVDLLHFTLNIIGAKDGDTISSYSSRDLHIQGVGLREVGSGKAHTFIPELDDLILRLGKQQYLVGNGLYSISYDSLIYVHRDESLLVEEVNIEPRISLDSFALRNYGKNFERAEMGLKALQIDGLGLHRIITTGDLDISKVTVDSLRANIYKDESNPMDPNLDVSLPNKMLQDLDFNLSLDTLRYNGTRFSFYEKMPNTNNHLETYLTSVRGEIRNIRSARWALDSGPPLEVDFRADLLGAIELTLAMELPYGEDALYITGGTSGSSNLAALNQTTIPAMNLRFGDGRLHGISFKARGNSHHLEGEFTMLYSDLDVELLKPDLQKKKTLSWVANTFVKQSNPNRKGRTLTANIYAERDPTKGVVGYVIKGISSGIANTFNPLGKNRRE